MSSENRPALTRSLAPSPSPGATRSGPDSDQNSSRVQGFRRYAWATLGLTLFVILFGAVVRITGSGAGCGQHWPSCNGEVVHLPRRVETLIELTHRVTSGLAFLFVVGLVVFAVRTHPPGRVRTASYVALVFMVVEALIGAALVLLGLVDRDASLGRALVMPAHLVSTYALTAALFVAAAKPRHPTATIGSTAWARTVALGAFVLVLVSATGAVTALGDTLYPPSAPTLAARVAEDHGVTATFLQRLRVAHPVLAVLGGALVAWLGVVLARESGHLSARRSSRTLTVVILAQLLFGLANVWLSAPGAMQVGHLALAVSVWLAFVALTLDTAA